MMAPVPNTHAALLDGSYHFHLGEGWLELAIVKHIVDSLGAAETAIAIDTW